MIPSLFDAAKAKSREKERERSRNRRLSPDYNHQQSQSRKKRRENMTSYEKQMESFANSIWRYEKTAKNALSKEERNKAKEQSTATKKRRNIYIEKYSEKVSENNVDDNEYNHVYM